MKKLEPELVTLDTRLTYDGSVPQYWPVSATLAPPVNPYQRLQCHPVVYNPFENLHFSVHRVHTSVVP